MSRYNLGALALFALALLLGAPRVAHAETYNTCTGFITSLPAVITTQGTWCFKQDLATAVTTGNAITVNTNNVTIDCNNYKLGGLAAGLGTQTVGIYADSRLNLTVRHCSIRGFMWGVQLIGSGGGHAIEDNRFDNNTYVGIGVTGDGSVIQSNRVFDTGQTTVFANAYGIAGTDSVDITDNTVSNVVARTGGGGSVFGIQVSQDSSGRILRNGVRGLLKDGAGTAYGIDSLTGTDRIVIADNQLVGDTLAGSKGLFCITTNSRAKDNVINGFGTTDIGSTSCGDAGGNDFTP
jgi:hypothetical protein